MNMMNNFFTTELMVPVNAVHTVTNAINFEPTYLSPWIILIPFLGTLASFALGFLTGRKIAIVGICVAFLGLAATFVVTFWILTNSPLHSEKQINSFIQWGAEVNLVNVTEEQAEEILQYQVSEEQYDERYEVARSKVPRKIPVEDIYGNKVDVLLVKTSDTTWVLKQYTEHTVTIPDTGDKK